MISHKYKFICPRIGKCASSTLVKFFKQYDSNLIDEGHEAILDTGFENFLHGKHRHNILLGVDHNSYYKFAFVRNPFTRIVSAFHEFQKPDMFYELKEVIKSDSRFNIIDTLTKFNVFVDMTMVYPHIHWNSQYNMIMDGSRKLVDYLGKVETIDRDITVICERLGLDINTPLPRERVSGHGQSYISYYNDELISKISSKYKTDLFALNYSFKDIK